MHLLCVRWCDSEYFWKIFVILAPSPKDFLFITEENTIFFFGGSSNIIDLLIVETPDGLPEHFIDLSVIQFQFFLFSPEGYRLSAHHECKKGSFFFLKPVLLYATFFDRIVSFTSLFNHGVTFETLLVTPSRSHPHTRAVDETTAALNSCHSISASAVRSGSPWHNDIIFLISLITFALKHPKRIVDSLC